jgi:hypothetical protein
MADDARDGIALLPSDDTGFLMRFLPTRLQKAAQNQQHLHLTSTSLENQQQTVAKSLWLGARHIDVGQRPEEGHGGPKISWGGPPLMPKTGKDRMHFDLALRSTVTSKRRPSVSPLSGRRALTSARARSAGWSWPIPTAMSSVC